ncbi:hypothetical protein [Kiloniella majae]|uniref:hypothetical protein n=1 Tax=Kiloniella majae TaxID=1938558 RepID=UPI0015C5137D|nr:hypothetical protein [Kiloniella majae]
MSYTAPIHTIPAGERLEIPGEGKFVRVLEASDWFEIGLDGEALHFIEQGLAVESSGFKKVVLRNPQNAPITVRLGVANGVIHDSRFSVPGTMPVQVENFPAQVNLSSVDQLGVHKLGDLVFNTGALNSTVTIVTPGDNTAGVIIRTLDGWSTAGYLGLFIGTVAPTQYLDNSPSITRIWSNIVNYSSRGNTPLPLMIPAGKGIYVNCSSNSGSRPFSMTYDLL